LDSGKSSLDSDKPEEPACMKCSKAPAAQAAPWTDTEMRNRVGESSSAQRPAQSAFFHDMGRFFRMGLISLILLIPHKKQS
jgi:hypothetical protein